MNRFFTAVFFILASSLLSSSALAQSQNHTVGLPPFPPHRQDPDGSVIIAWKLLKRYSAPRLRYNNHK
jgi:hypothetical protein